MPPEVEQVDNDGNQQGKQAPKHIGIEKMHNLKTGGKDTKSLSVSEQMATTVVSTMAVFGKGGTGVLVARM
jgi:hypothetical protein